ncbi:hypothetical protein CHUAL_005795 [Chamberlinius hualienensis]
MATTMEQPQTMRDIPLRWLSSSSKERQALFEYLQSLITTSDVPEGVIKGIFRLLPSSLPRYVDSKSRSLVEKLIITVAKRWPAQSFIQMATTCANYANGMNQLYATPYVGKCCVTALRWLCAVMRTASKETDSISQDEFKKGVEAVMLLMNRVAACNRAIYTRKAYRQLSYTWAQNKEMTSKFVNVCLTAEPSVEVVILLSYLIKYCVEIKDTSILPELKKVAVEGMIKSVVGSKTKPASYILDHCSPFLKLLNHEEFKTVLLPALLKSLLRNPENIILCVSQILSVLILDLSNYALELGKTIGSGLHSKEEFIRNESCLAIKNLSLQCSETEALQSLFMHLVGIMNGSEGKLTVTAQRIGVITGLGYLSYSTAPSASLQPLVALAAKEFTKILEQEVHEGTLMHTLSMLSLWCARITTEAPSILIDWFNKGIGLKTSTATVRNCYFSCMLATFKGDALCQGEAVIPVTLKAVERAYAQPSQMAVVTEGLSATLLLLRLRAQNPQLESKLATVWNVLFDMEKQVFITEKFLTSASEDALGVLISVIKHLFLDFPEKLPSDSGSYLRAVIYILSRPSYAGFRNATAVVKRLISSFGGGQTAALLLKEFASFIHNPKTKVVIGGIDESNDTQEVSTSVQVSDGSVTISPKLAVACLDVICTGSTHETEDQNTILFECLMCAHHPAIASVQPDCWERLAIKMKQDPAKYLQKNLQNVWGLVLESTQLTSTHCNIIKTLVRLCSDVVLPLVVEHLEKQCRDPELQTVTKKEYEIYLTPEGELCNKLVIDNVHEEIVPAKNIKKESKLYSYKDQMDELELRKEIEAKKLAKGIKAKPGMTPKQEEAMKNELARESVIRNRISSLCVKVTHALTVAASALEASSASLFYCTRIVRAILSALRSPVSAQKASGLFLHLQKFVLAGNLNTLGRLVAYVTLRLWECACDLDKAWCQEELISAVTRTIHVIHTVTVSAERDEFNEPKHDSVQALNAAGFTYIFPLLEKALWHGGEKINSSESSMVEGLEIIVEHTQMRMIRGSTDLLNDPALLPRKAMFSLLIDLLESTSGKIQVLCGRVLLQVVQSASGNPGCASATKEEIGVLVSALQSSSDAARDGVLRSLQVLGKIIKANLKKELDMFVVRRLWVARFDPNPEIQRLAQSLWDSFGLKAQLALCNELLSDILHPIDVIRRSASSALAAVLSVYKNEGPAVLHNLLELYREKLTLPPPSLDLFGRVVSEQPIDNWEPRSGIALAIRESIAHLSPAIVTDLMNFFMFEGLGDRHPTVQRDMLEAAQAVIDIHGNDTIGILLPMFETCLKKAPDSSSYDFIRQSIVVLMGGVAKHLDKDDPKIQPIVNKLIEALSTPSQQVQEAAANCLPSLVPAIKDQAPIFVKSLLDKLTTSENYGVRRGAAYGLAGMVKGLGILSLKQLDIMSTLTEAIQNKSNYRAREGALFAFEMLCNLLGRLFEPYVVHVLPHLLLCFGDNNQYVRQATDDTAKAVMSKLSAHGVKLVLPSLLAALEEDSWRTKTGSIDLLGAMAFCAPKQLSSCLPSIVPKLIEVLSDSHVRVQKAGAQALKQIGSVIRNPEIQALVPTLLDALQDPSKKTATCLQTLLATKFVHFIDSPSLALIMPVVQRAFQDRSTETRKMAAQIIGNMYSLTDQKDLAPYLPNVIPGLKQSLLDPVPEVRGVAAAALGAMVKGLGESSFEDLLPWLMQTLTSEASSVDRSGAAQGLSEVVGGLGIEKLHKLMPDIIATAERADVAPHVRDGYIMMFIYMPVVFQKEFTRYISQIINPILKALADESEFVRETALRAGQRIVTMYAESAIQLLLPELEKGLFDENWRIRYSSVQLLGDLLYKISGVTGKMTTETADEDDNFGTEQSHKAILGILGGERRNRVLAGLYMGRSDTALMVRQAALHVWKIVVTNTPRTLREILPTLFSLLLGCLASTSYDKRQVAARTLGDLVRKLGERVLPDIIPILEQGLESDRADQRQGVCIGLSEIMMSTSKEMVMMFVESLVPTVRKALCDPLPEVRQAAAKTFDSLHNTVGNRALDDILSPLLKQLGNDKVGDYALDGLRQVMAVKNKIVLPYLIPQLTTTPVNTKALSILASVAGDALTKHLGKILPALLLSLSEACDTPNEQQELEYCQTVVLSVTEYPGVHTVIDDLLEATKSKNVSLRRAAAMLLYSYCSQSKADFSQYVPQLLRGLIHLFTDKNGAILQLAWEALNAVTKDLDANEQAQYVADVRQAVRFAVSDISPEKLLPGFCLQKGIAPILPIFREAIINGSPEVKEQAAIGLGEVIHVTSAEALKPSVVNITGPLIRILGDRYVWNVRVAVLDTLALLLAKVGAMLKPFLPQLQTTFLKALSDPSRQVRIKAGAALSHLIVIHTRADPLFTELHTNVKNADDAAMRETMLQALRSVITPAGDKMSDPIRKAVLGTLQGLIGVNEEATRLAAAGCLGALCRTLPENELKTVINDILLDDDQTLDWVVRHGRCAALMVALIETPDSILIPELASLLEKNLQSYITTDRVPVVLSAVRCVGIYLQQQLIKNNPFPQQLVQTLAKLMNHTSNEVKQLVAQVASYLARNYGSQLPDTILKPMVPMLVNGTKEKNSVVKTSSESALVALLRLRNGDEVLQNCMKLLDAGAREALSDVITKVLRKVVTQPEPKEGPLDNTILT